MRTALFLALAAALSAPTLAHARWMKEDEAPAHFDEITSEIHVHKDHSVETTQNFSVVVDKESAVQELSNFRYRYTPSTTQAKVVSARMVVGNRVFIIDPKLVEDRPVPDQKPGYDDVREIHVAFSRAAVGSTLELKLWRKDNARPFPGMLSEVIPFTHNYPIKSQSVKFESDVPLAWRVHDPFKELKVTEHKAKKGVKLEISSDKTVFHRLIDEPFAAFSEPQAPVLYIGNGPNWADFGNRIAAEYEKVLAAPLPDELKKIVETLKGKEDKLEQVELVLAEIHKLVHSLGTWQTVKGQHFPKALKDTIANRFGDCKDYATITLAVLRALGHDASLVWTQVDAVSPTGPTSGRVVQFQPPVAGTFFNHAIVKAKIGGKDYWFDPTTPVAYVRGVAGHLAGAYALVLRSGDSRLETIPFGSPDDNPIEATRFLTVNNDKTFDELLRSKSKGFIASVVNSQSPKEEQLLREGEDTITELLYKEAAPKPGKGEFWIDRARSGLNLGGNTASGAGVKFEVPKDLIPLTQDPSKVSGGILFPLPSKQTLTTFIQGGTLKSELPKECKVETPFFKLSRSFAVEGGIVKVTESSELRAAYVSASDMRGQQLKQAQETLGKCWTETTLVFQYDGLIDPAFKYSHTQPWKLTSLQLETEKVKKQIPKLWSKITGKKTEEKTFTYFQVAPEWSKDKTPDQIKAKAQELLDGWEGQSVRPALVKALMLEVIQKAPRDAEGMALLAASEIQSGFIKNDEYDAKAIERAKWASYLALEIDPKSAAANRALALYLAATKDNAALAIDAAKYALQLDPKSAHAKSTLARAYLRNKEPKKALETLGTSDDLALKEAIYTALSDSEKLKQVYEDQLKKKPTVWAYLNYAAYSNSHGDPDKAIELAKKALEFREVVTAHKILSDAYVRKGSAAMDKSKKVEDGLEWLGKALIEDDTNVLAHQIVGSILIQRGRETKDERLMALGAQHAKLANQLEMGHEASRAPASTPAPAAAPTTAASTGTPAATPKK